MALVVGKVGRKHLDGTDAADTMIGTASDDQMNGGAGNDLMRGGFGNDTMLGGDGEEWLEGGLGNDRLLGDAGRDTLLGGDGDDLLLGGDGDDLLRGGDGDDLLEGGTGNDTLNGGLGDDLLRGGDGDDRLQGADGNDILWGGAGDDLLKGGDGNDLVIGGPGSDLLAGSDGADVLLSRSDAGEPTITAAPGLPRVMAGVVLGGSQDTLDGGNGPDIFRFELLLNARAGVIARNLNADGSIDWQRVTGENGAPHDHWVEGIGNDIIKDYSRAEGDRIEILGHDVKLSGITYRDVDGDARLDSVITLHSSLEGGVHTGDALGSITVLGQRVMASELVLRPDVVIGAFSRPELGPLPDERFGLLPLGWTGPSDWVGP